MSWSKMLAFRFIVPEPMRFCGERLLSRFAFRFALFR